MRKRFFIVPVIALPLILSLPLAGQGKGGTVINGTFSSGFDLQDARTYPGGDHRFFYGWYNTANIKLKAAPGDALSFLISANISALNGFYAHLAAAAFAVELERLYFRVRTAVADVEAGLIRIPRGYGYLFSPLEILNPKDSLNALDPSGRPMGRWGVHAIFYPQDLWKIECFGLAPDDPLELQAWGSRFGAATAFSLDKWNFDILYTLLLPEVPYQSDPAPLAYLNNDYTQVAGIAVKADIGIGLFGEALYRFEHRMFKTDSYYGKPFRGYEGIEAAVGADYTFAEQNLYLLCEYLFYGPGQVDWQEQSLDTLYLAPDWEDYAPAARIAIRNPDKKPLSYSRHDYLFLLLRYSPGRDLSLGFSALAGLDDLSALATAFCEYGVVQGMTLQASMLVPLDRKMFDPGAEAGEWGSISLGFHQMTRIGVKVKF